MELGLGTRHALVVGSSRGLGLAVATELVCEGASVTICGRSERDVAAAHNQLTAMSRSEEPLITSFVGDIGDPSDREQLLEVALNQPRPLGIVVTNAAGPPTGTFTRTTMNQWRATYAMTFESAAETIRLALPTMQAQEFGRIITITSMAVKQPIPDLVLSNSMRLALAGLAKTLSIEMAPFGITVNNLMPGYTDTQRVRDLARAAEERGTASANDFMASLRSQIPVGRLGQPHEFAAVAAFLASDRAAYVTGQSIAVDGGWTKGAL